VLWRIAPELIGEIRQARMQVATPRRTASDDLRTLLTARLSATDLTALASEHHVDLAAAHALLLARPMHPSDQWAQMWVDRLARATPAHWATIWHDALAVLLTEPQATDEMLPQLQRLFTEDDTIPVALGLGRPTSTITGWQRSLRDAEQALHVVQRQPAGGLQRYADLGVLRLIFALQAADEAALHDFAHDTLTPLIRADAHHEDALLTTLAAYFAANGNLTGAARDLDLHRNTLMYRLRRIEELLGASLDDADLRLALHLALKIRQLRL
jgi:purine catabolism regulator